MKGKTMKERTMKGETMKASRYNRWDETIDVVMMGMSVLMLVFNFMLGVQQTLRSILR